MNFYGITASRVGGKGQSKWLKRNGSIVLFNNAMAAVVEAAKVEDGFSNMLNGQYAEYAPANADLKAMLEELGAAQTDEDEAWCCPRCGNNTMNPILEDNAISRYAAISICDMCGMAEAMESVPGTEITELYNWAAFSREWEDDNE